MTGSTSEDAVAERRSAEDLRADCERARVAVAADPTSESAAEALWRAVDRARQEIYPPQVVRQQVAPEVAQAARLLQRNQIEPAEILLRRYHTRVADDPAAMMLMADIAMRCGFPDEAQKILRTAIGVKPDRIEARLALAKLLPNLAKQSERAEFFEEALDVVNDALTVDPADEEALSQKSTILSLLKRFDESQATLEARIRHHPESSAPWITLGHLHKTLGKFGEAVAAYRTGIALDPGNGSSWMLLSDLKLARFFPGDIRRMEEALENQEHEDSRTALHFALYAANHQAKNFEEAARHLEQGNGLRLKKHPHNIDEMSTGIDEAIAVYTPAFFKKRTGLGSARPDPIFIVGMPRSGSTLVEQILSSHSTIEGTSELLAVQQIQAELLNGQGVAKIDSVVADLDGNRLEELGERYISLTRFHRKTDRPRFTDKNPGNWRQSALIHAMLPNAKIVDIRRNPMDCCFGNLTQHFKKGVNFSYGQKEMATQYRDYVRLMRHFDEVQPDMVHRVIYDDLVDNLEDEVRRLFDYLELPFEEACLRFYETERAVHTPSSEQVRQPINRSGFGKWRDYEPWLGELRAALGPTLTDWRA